MGPGKKKLSELEREVADAENYQIDASQADDVLKSLEDGSLSFTEALHTAREARVRSIHATKRELHGPLAAVATALTDLEEIQTALTKRVSDSSDNVLNVTDALDKRLQDLLGLEEYQEEGVLDRLRANLTSVVSETKTLDAWKTTTEATATAWRSQVQQAFADLGHTLEVEGLAESAREKQQMALASQLMDALESELNFDLENLDAVSAGRIQAIANNAAKAIHELMLDSSLSEEERSRRIAKIKETMRRDAMAVLNEVLGLGLNGEGTMRDLDAAMADVDGAEKRMNALDNANHNEAHVSENTIRNELRDLYSKAQAILQSQGGATPAGFPTPVALYGKLGTTDLRGSATGLDALKRLASGVTGGLPDFAHILGQFPAPPAVSSASLLEAPKPPKRATVSLLEQDRTARARSSAGNALRGGARAEIPEAAADLADKQAAESAASIAETRAWEKQLQGLAASRHVTLPDA